MAVWEVEVDGGVYEVETPGDAPPTGEQVRQTLSLQTQQPRGSDVLGAVTESPFTKMAAPAIQAVTGVPVQPILGELQARGEEVLPAAGQLVGGRFGGLPGAIGGTMFGEAGRQSIGALRGERLPFKTRAGRLALAGGTTATLEGLTRGAVKLFPREAAKRTLKVAGTKVNEIRQALIEMGEANPALQVSTQKIAAFVNKELARIKVPFGKGYGVLRKWGEFLNNPETPPNLSPATLIELEDDLGAAAKFARPQRGMMQVPQVEKRAVNVGLKQARTAVSNEVDAVASKAGFPEFAKRSKEVSKARQTLAQREPSGLAGAMLQMIPGAGLLTETFPQVGFQAARLAASGPFRVGASEAARRVGELFSPRRRGP